MPVATFLRTHVIAVLTLIVLCVLWVTKITGSEVISDSAATLRMAVNLEHHGVISMDETVPFEPSMYREPVPVLFNAVLVSTLDALRGPGDLNEYFSGDRARWLKYQNVLWMLAICIATYGAIRGFTRSVWMGILGLLLVQAAFSYRGLQACSVDTLCTDIPATALLLGASLLLLPAVSRPGLTFAALTGAAFGVLTLTKAAFLYVFVGLLGVLAVGALLQRRQLDLKVAFAKWAVMALVFGAVVAPWMYRNQQAFDSSAISERGGLSLITRAMKDRVTPREYVGAFYAWTPRPLRPVVGLFTGFEPQDLEAGGSLQLFNRYSSRELYESDRTAERAGRPQDAVAYYYKGRAELVKARNEAAAAGHKHPEIAADQALTARALTMMRERPFRHLAMTLPYLWRGALFAFPLLALGFIFSLRWREHSLLLFGLPSLGLVMFYGLFANFEERYGMPTYPLAIAVGVTTAWLFWQRRQLRGQYLIASGRDP